MTKSDFERVARALRGSFATGAPTCAQQWQNDVQAIASAFSESNPRFDKARFLLACGLTTGADDPAQPTASGTPVFPFDRRWVCQVMRSGYHNGAACHADEPHASPWNCGYRWECSLTDEDYARLTLPR